MNYISLFLTYLTLRSVIAVSAQLNLIEYEPLIFQLKFTQPVQNSSFQLLFNNLYDISYIFQTDSQYTDLYRLRADPTNIQKTTNLQTYTLLFNNPLDVSNGNLDLDSYSISAKKSDILVKFPSALGIVLVLSAYLSNTFTQIGKLISQFIHIFVLYMFQSRMTTTITQEIYTWMLMIPPVKTLKKDWNNYQGFVMVCMVVPVAIIFLFGLIGFIYKRRAVRQKSILGTIIYDELVFNVFVKSIRLFLFNLFYNSIMFLIVTKESTLFFYQTYKKIGYVLVYFNFLTCFAICYLKIYILNPKINKSKENRQKYLKSNEFKSFRLLHQRVHLNPWYKRNYDILQTFKILFLAGIFFCGNIFQYFAVLLQFVHIFFLFTVRPLIQEFYSNTKVVCRLLLFTSYTLIVLGNLYFSLGEATFSYAYVSKYIIGRDAAFLVCQLLLIGILFAEIYFKCSNLNYQIKLVKEANEYKLEFVEKNRRQSQSQGAKFIGHSDKFLRSQEIKGPSFSQFTSSSGRANREFLSNKRLLLEKTNRPERKSKVEIEMMDINAISHEIEKQLRTEKEGYFKKDESKKSIKWKQESLLEDIIHTKK